MQAVDGAIVGFRRPDQVDPIVAAANLELDDEDVAEIDALSAESSAASSCGWLTGQMCPSGASTSR